MTKHRIKYFTSANKAWVITELCKPGLPYDNNKGTHQPANLRRLISIFAEMVYYVSNFCI